MIKCLSLPNLYYNFLMEQTVMIGKYVLGKDAFALIIMIVLLCATATSANAHKAMIFAWVDEDTVFTESKFSGGRKVKGREVVVYDLKEKPLLKGKTNDRGKFSFKAPDKKGMKIVLLAGMGHRGEWTIFPEEIPGGVGGQVKTGTYPGDAIDGKEQPGRPEQVSGISPEEIQMAVEKALDRRLRPVMKMLAESRERQTSLTDILGGIGYILGLVGIACYFNYRRKKKE